MTDPRVPPLSVQELAREIADSTDLDETTGMYQKVLATAEEVLARVQPQTVALREPWRRMLECRICGALIEEKDAQRRGMHFSWCSHNSPAVSPSPPAVAPARSEALRDWHVNVLLNGYWMLVAKFPTQEEAQEYAKGFVTSIRYEIREQP